MRTVYDGGPTVEFTSFGVGTRGVVLGRSRGRDWCFEQKPLPKIETVKNGPVGFCFIYVHRVDFLLLSSLLVEDSDVVLVLV